MYELIYFGIPIIFVGLGILAKTLAENGFKWEHLFLGLELILATFTASSSHALDQWIRAQQYQEAEVQIERGIPAGQDPRSNTRWTRLRERRDAIQQNLFHTTLAIVFSVVALMIIAIGHQRHHQVSGNAINRRFMLAYSVMGLGALVAFIFLVKGTKPEPLVF